MASLVYERENCVFDPLTAEQKFLWSAEIVLAYSEIVSESNDILFYLSVMTFIAHQTKLPASDWSTAIQLIVLQGASVPFARQKKKDPDIRFVVLQ